jgi:hypothetical protein
VTPRVVTALGGEVEADGGCWVVEERGEYLVVAVGADRATFGGAALDRDPRGFVLRLSFWTGRAEVMLHYGGDRESVPLVVRPPAYKLVADEWEALLDEIDRCWPGCTLGVEGGLHGHAGDEGLERLLALLAFEALLPELLRDLGALLEALRTREHFPDRPVPLRMVKRLDMATARRIVANPRAAALLQPMAGRADADDRVEVSHRHREVSVDHPANRALRWLLERLSDRLVRVAALLRARATCQHDSLTDARTWCEERAIRLDRAAERLDHLVRRSALAHVRSAPPDAAALLTLTDDPVYARVYRRCRRWLAPRLERGDGADVPIRASFDLYERWCLLAVRSALAEAFPDARWTDWTTTAVDAFSPSSRDRAAVGVCAAGIVTLYDNLTFSAWSVTGSRFSISTERRPDFVITWKGHDGGCRWVLLDAKYRASYDSIAEALQEIHVYRDALRWLEFSGACRAAAILVPRVATRAARWAETSFLEKFDLGLIPLRPKAPTAALAAWLRRWLCSAAPPDAPSRGADSAEAHRYASGGE